MISNNINTFDIHEYMVANIVGSQYYKENEFKVHVPLLMPYITPSTRTVAHSFNTNSIYINDDSNVKFNVSVTEQKYLSLPVLPALVNSIWTNEVSYPDYLISDDTKIMIFSINKNIKKIFIQSVIPED